MTNIQTINTNIEIICLIDSQIVNIFASETKTNLIIQTIKIHITMGATHLTKAEFLRKIADIESNPREWNFLGDKPAIIDFYAEWCGPCKMVSPIMDELADEFKGKVDIYKVNTEKEEELAAMFGIRSIPSILFIPMDGQPQMAQGAMPKASFVQTINDILIK